jgi:hypothetical protein
MFAISQGNRNNDLWVIERFSGSALDALEFKTQELSHNAHSSFNGYCGDLWSICTEDMCALSLLHRWPTLSMSGH